ncbi:zinc finger BED domain-containing protein RICESLEEPER 3-like [Raphanus sativus]|uniref:Zinc finger BED domain-containing protein RICESLEEPER 3-like n=1 Tax=Raphanus sativus TaxID=3726 RepID=A0A6J0L1U9_RAPSA|nr:zinc finger BED domain-containing protein RICESLEEPER 3-like [Raphanus sativus]
MIEKIPDFDDELDEEELDEDDDMESDERESRRRSDVWCDFTVVDKANGTMKAQCNHCRNQYAWHSHSHGTSGLRRHRLRCRMYQRNNRGQQQINFAGKLQSRKYDHTIFRQMTICRNTARSDVNRLYESERDTLRRDLATLPGRVSLTSDLWTSVKREGYMCVTTHYIDRNWKLNSKIITFCALAPPHTGMNVAMQLLESMKVWG